MTISCLLWFPLIFHQLSKHNFGLKTPLTIEILSYIIHEPWLIMLQTNLAINIKYYRIYKHCWVNHGKSPVKTLATQIFNGHIGHSPSQNTKTREK
jgi:hypothetical protein